MKLIAKYALLLITIVIVGCETDDLYRPSIYDVGQDVKTEIVFSGKRIYRCPSACITNKGFLLVVCHNQPTEYDTGDINIEIARKGLSETEWVKKTIFETNSEKGRAMSPIFLIDRKNGRIYLFAVRFRNLEAIGYYNKTEEIDFVYKFSDDDGESWTDELSLKHKWNTNEYTAVSTSASNGIVLGDGTYLLPTITIKDRKLFSSLLIKRPNVDWYFSSHTPNEWDSECTVYLDNDSKITLDCRTTGNYRNKYHYDIESDTFTLIDCNQIDSYIPIKSEIVKFPWDGTSYYLMSYPDTRRETRENMSLFGSKNGIQWKFLYRYEAGINGCGYSNVLYYQNIFMICYETNVGGNAIKLLDISSIIDNIVKQIN